MREITLTKTRKTIVSFEDLFKLIGIGIMGLLGVFIPHPLLRGISVVCIIFCVWGYIDQSLVPIEEEITLQVVGGKR
jgi:hypothetical protein